MDTRRIEFAGQEMILFPQGALFWRERRALVIADLHFEKASWFASRGQMLPPYDSAATLDDLATLIALLDPAEIWCLGDSFHDDDGPHRLPAHIQADFLRLASRTRWTWIAGNHDGYAAMPCGVTRAEAAVDGILLRHEADPAETRFEISGHFHPKWRVRLRGRSVSRRCFVHSATRLILPAFGCFTGGLDAASDPIARLMGREASALVPVGERILRFPLYADRNVISKM